MLSHLGKTRSTLRPDHAFIAPDSHVGLQLPSWQHATITTLIAPQLGARFAQFFAAMPAGSTASPPLADFERFIYVLEGQLEINIYDNREVLSAHDYAFLPANSSYAMRAVEASRLNVFERRYISLEESYPPPAIFGNEQDIAGEAFMGDEAVSVRKLLPDDPGFDIGINTMTFEPGASLPFVEGHFMEHGLLMLSGEGIYRLSDCWYPITEGDVLWMGAFCPQWFAALGKTPAKYLLYKENNRDPLAYQL